jgi:hypothetical protein
VNDAGAVTSHGLESVTHPVADALRPGPGDGPGGRPTLVIDPWPTRCAPDPATAPAGGPRW